MKYADLCGYEEVIHCIPYLPYAILHKIIIITFCNYTHTIYDWMKFAGQLKLF